MEDKPLVSIIIPVYNVRPWLAEAVGGRVYFAPPAFSADNAAGVALLTAMLHQDQ